MVAPAPSVHRGAVVEQESRRFATAGIAPPALGFTVLLKDGDPSAPFSYCIVAKRLGFERERLAPAAWADTDLGSLARRRR